MPARFWLWVFYIINNLIHYLFKITYPSFNIILMVFVIVATEPALVLFIVFALYALAGPVNTFRTVDKMTLDDVVGDHEEADADFKDNEDDVESPSADVNTDETEHKTS